MDSTVVKPIYESRFLQTAGGSEVLYELTAKNTHTEFSFFRFINLGSDEVKLNVQVKKGNLTLPLIRNNFPFKPGYQLDILDEIEKLNFPSTSLQIIAVADKAGVVVFHLSGREITRV